MRRPSDKKPVNLAEERWKSPQLFKRIVKTFHEQPTGPNMPKRQPRPRCHSNVRRLDKTVAGANYYCNKCKQSFFVKVGQENLVIKKGLVR